MNLNERFTDLADAVSEGVGRWWFTAVSALALIGWIAYGVFLLAPSVEGWFTSTQWNFPLNTITTVGEWFIGALMLAAANRSERRNRALHERVMAIHENLQRLVEKEEGELQQIEREIEGK